MSKLSLTDKTISIKNQIDIIYGLLQLDKKQNSPRDSICSFEMLITKAKTVEANFSENFDSSHSSSLPKVKDERKVKPSRAKYTFCHNFGHTIETSKCRKYASTKSTKVVNISASISTVNSDVDLM